MDTQKTKVIKTWRIIFAIVGAFLLLIGIAMLSSETPKFVWGFLATIFGVMLLVFAVSGLESLIIRLGKQKQFVYPMKDNFSHMVIQGDLFDHLFMYPNEVYVNDPTKPFLFDPEYDEWEIIPIRHGNKWQMKLDRTFDSFEADRIFGIHKDQNPQLFDELNQLSSKELAIVFFKQYDWSFIPIETNHWVIGQPNKKMVAEKPLRWEVIRSTKENPDGEKVFRDEIVDGLRYRARYHVSTIGYTGEVIEKTNDGTGGKETKRVEAIGVKFELEITILHHHPTVFWLKNDSDPLQFILSALNGAVIDWTNNKDYSYILEHDHNSVKETDVWGAIKTDDQTFKDACLRINDSISENCGSTLVQITIRKKEILNKNLQEAFDKVFIAEQDKRVVAKQQEAIDYGRRLQFQRLGALLGRKTDRVDKDGDPIYEIPTNLKDDVIRLLQAEALASSSIRAIGTGFVGTLFGEDDKPKSNNKNQKKK